MKTWESAFSWKKGRIFWLAWREATRTKRRKVLLEKFEKIPWRFLTELHSRWVEGPPLRPRESYFQATLSRFSSLLFRSRNYFLLIVSPPFLFLLLSVLLTSLNQTRLSLSLSPLSFFFPWSISNSREKKKNARTNRTKERIWNDRES